MAQIRGHLPLGGPELRGGGLPDIAGVVDLHIAAHLGADVLQSGGIHRDRAAHAGLHLILHRLHQGVAALQFQNGGREVMGRIGLLPGPQLVNGFEIVRQPVDPGGLVNIGTGVPLPLDDLIGQGRVGPGAAVLVRAAGNGGKEDGQQHDSCDTDPDFLFHRGNLLFMDYLRPPGPGERRAPRSAPGSGP